MQLEVGAQTLDLEGRTDHGCQTAELRDPKQSSGALRRGDASDRQLCVQPLETKDPSANTFVFLHMPAGVAQPWVTGL